MRLGWNPLRGVTGYIVRWREETGETLLIHQRCVISQYNDKLLIINVPCVDTGGGLSVTLPASSSSYQVTGLRLGHRYRFTVQPTFTSGLGTESSVTEHTGNAETHVQPLQTASNTKTSEWVDLSVCSVRGRASGRGVSGASVHRSR